MKKILNMFLILCLLFIFVLLAGAVQYQLDDLFTKNRNFILHDFDSKSKNNSLYGGNGLFAFDSTDRESKCQASFIPDDTLHKKGYHLVLTYDVDSPIPCFNGWWTTLLYADYLKLKAISFMIRGDAAYGFSDTFKIELKDIKNRKIEYYIEDITNEWQKYTILFEDFSGNLETFDWYNTKEFVVVFEDWKFKTKEGKYYIDDIEFLTKEDQTPTFSEISKRYRKEFIKEELEKDKNISVKLNENRTINITLKNLQFEPNTTKLLNASTKTLDLIAAVLSGYLDRKIIITGHTADWGDKKIQMQLSIQRAKSIYNYIMTHSKLDPKNVSYQGRGSTEPIAPNDTEVNMAKNRRVEIFIQ
jgi:outer membrane protein OmpA-like peptidoglycan-associated protein